MNRTLLAGLAAACFVVLSGKADPRLSFVSPQLSFEPNIGQIASPARFVLRGAPYRAEIGPAQATFQFGESDAISMTLLKANQDADMRGEALLPGQSAYFPGPDRSQWHSGIPSYSRVRELAVYPGVDLTYYGSKNSLEYDFVLRPNADASLVQFQLSGAASAALNASGDLVLTLNGRQVSLLKPVAYQLAKDGASHLPVEAAYRLDAGARDHSTVVSFSLGAYDHSRALVIDPLLSYTQYTASYPQAVAADSSGNTYVATGYYSQGNGFTLTKYGPTGQVLYTTMLGSGDLVAYGMAVDSTGRVYIAGEANSNATLPTSTNSYSTTRPNYSGAFFIQVAASGASVPYATFLSTTTNYAFASGVAIDSSGNAYITGAEAGSDFPTTTGAYQTSHPNGYYTGFVAKFNPAMSGTASLVYSTLLGTPSSTNYLWGIAVDSANNAYVTGSGAAGFPVTAGAFRYNGYESANGGVFVTKVNTTGTALVYSAYLGYGTGYGIAVDGQANAYVTGSVGYEDFPTTAGAYQASYAGGFVTEVNPAGSAEVFSTFLGGPSSYISTNVVPLSISLPPGCPATSPKVITCTPYVSGWTSSTDFPAINAVETAPATNNQSGFVVQLAANGQSALFSSYLNGLTSGVGDHSFDSYGNSPSIAVDSAGNINYIASLYTNGDFPITLTNANPNYGILAKIAPAAGSLTFSEPGSVSFGYQPVGISTSQDGGTMTVRVTNFGSAAAAISSITVSPASIFSESDNCGTSLAGGAYCTLNLDFTPGGPGARSGTVTVTSSSSNSPLTIALTGTGQDQAYAATSLTGSAGLTFAPQGVGTASGAQSFTITNYGTLTTTLSFSFSNSDFLETNNCPTQLAPGANCTVNVVFKPSQAGLRTDNLYVSGSNGGPSISVPVNGTGTLSGATATLVFTGSALTFQPQAVGTSSSNEANDYVYISNTGTEPVTVQAITVSGDFGPGSSNCATTPFQLNPQASCYVYVNFAPTVAGVRTGALTFTDTASGSPHIISLTGTGLATLATDVYPSAAVSFPDQAVGTEGNSQTIQLQNVGAEAVTVTRVFASSEFQINYNGCDNAIIRGNINDGSAASYYTCSVNVAFTPAAAGARTGTLTFIDSEPGSPHVVTLSGNGLTPSGTLALAPTGIVYSAQPAGTSSGVQYIYIENPGNTPITINSAAVTGNFSITTQSCQTPYTLAAGQTNCYVGILFSPAATGSLSGTLTVQSSAGAKTAALTGTGIAATQTLQLSPGSAMDFGSIVTATAGPVQTIWVQNTGSEAVTFSSAPILSGANASDFSISNNSCGGANSSLLAGANCYVNVRLTPEAAGPRSATLTFTDNASGTTQSVSLTGTGVAATPTYTLSSYEFSYQPQLQGTTSGLNTYVYFYNHGATPVTLQNAVITSGFIIPHGYDTCSGATISASTGSCYVYIEFSPAITTGNAINTGTLTFKSSAATVLISLPLAGYSLAPVTSASVNPTTTNFANQQPVGSTSAYRQIVLSNNGNEPLTIGAITGTDLGTAGSTAEFSIVSANGGYDYCSNATVPPNGTCSIYPTFTPNAAGTRTGTAKFPITYGNGTTTTITANLSGNAVAARNSAELSPSSGTFVDQAVGATSTYAMTVSLFNGGNLPFTVGTLTGVNSIVGTSISGEFSLAGANGGSDGCTGRSVAAGSSCQISVTFTPSATGSRTGSVTFPVTFTDKTTASPKVSLSGNGITAAKALTITPANLQFGTEVQTQTSNYQSIGVTNTGNVPVIIGGNSISTNAAEFAVYSDSCLNITLKPGTSCTVNVDFKPASTSTGPRTGVLTIADNSSGGPHSVALSGIAITAAQQIVLAPASLSFGNQVAGTASAGQVIYGTNQSSTGLPVTSVVLGGANAGDFQMSNGCNYFYAGSTCKITVTFSPLATSSGTRTATITETDGAPGSPRTISLSGVAVAAAPSVQFAPTAVSFPSQNVGSTSAAQTFTITNTGNANLVINNAASSNTAEFPLSLDGCSGNVLTPAQHCTVSVKFIPALGGTRTGSISVSDNAAGSPQALTVTGIGYGIPLATPGVTSIAYPSENIGTASAAQSVALTNTGTDTLHIAGIALTGANAGDFTLSANSCGTTLAPAATCSISAVFKPTAAGTRGASITITDNANNASGATQNVALSGTGIADPLAALSPATVAFGNANIGAAAAASSVTLTNSGSGPLTIASVAISGTNAADFTAVSSCGSTLVAGSNCKIAVTFKPTAAGARSATFTVTDNAGNAASATQTAALSGTGVAVPAAAVSPSSLTFNSTTIGSAAAAQTATVTNSGTGALTISGIAVGGTNAADFSQTNNCGTSLAAAASCTVSVTFSPKAAGSRSATVSITDNANNTSGSVQTIALAGTGLGVPAAAVSPASLSFPSTGIGISSAASSVTLTNSGSGALTISSVTFTGANGGDFSVSSNPCGSSLAAGAHCSISVVFKPTAAGTRSATLQVLDNAGNVGSTQTVSVSGTGITIPASALSPASLTFGSTNLGTASAAQSITLTNSGSGALTIASIALSGTNAADFSQTNTCGTSVAAGANCAISVVFTPSAAGTRSATVTVTDNAGNTSGSTQSATLTGTGVTAPVAALTPTSISFGSVDLGITTGAQLATLTNSGSGALTISSIALGGPNPGDFSISAKTCGTTLAAGANCSVSVVFKPTAAGSRAAALTVSDNSNNTTTSQAVSLTGTGVAVPSANLSASSVAFPNTAHGSSSATQSVTLSNSGTGALSISSIALGGTNPADFKETNNCGSSLAAGSSCTLTLTFSPAAAGSFAASVIISDNAGGTSSTQTVSLTGTGT